MAVKSSERDFFRVQVSCDCSIIMQQMYFFFSPSSSFFASNLSSTEHSHVGLLFTNEEQEKVVS